MLFPHHQPITASVASDFGEKSRFLNKNYNVPRGRGFIPILGKNWLDA